MANLENGQTVGRDDSVLGLLLQIEERASRAIKCDWSRPALWGGFQDIRELVSTAIAEIEHRQFIDGQRSSPSLERQAKIGIEPEAGR